MKSRLIHYLGEKDLATIALGAVVQQVIVASSSWWLVKFVNAQTQGDGSLWPLWLFVASMILPYLPGYAALYWTQARAPKAQALFWDEHLSLLRGRLDLLTGTGLREKSSSLMRDAANLLHDLLHFWHQALGNVLNFILNALVIIAILDQQFLLGFLGAIVLATLLYIIISQRNQHWGAWKQATFSDVEQTNLRGWYNAILQNPFSFRSWMNQFQEKSSTYISASTKAAGVENRGNLILTALSFLPILVVIAQFALENRNNPNQLLVMAALLPRVFALWNVFNTNLGLAVQYSGLVGRLNDLERREAELFETRPLIERVQVDRIQLFRVNSASLDPLDCHTLLTGEIQSLNSGRFLLKGPNGSGKSTLLHWVKQMNSDRFFYLPTHSDLYIPSLDQKSVSTGQRLKQTIEALSENLPAGVGVLLDEWDANLDEATLKALDQLIEQMSTKHLVIEVRH